MAKLELLSPAGDMERLHMAVLYGAYIWPEQASACAPSRATSMMKSCPGR